MNELGSWWLQTIEFTADDLAWDDRARQPAGSRAWLEQLGWIRSAPPATVASCDSCGVDHVEAVQQIHGSGSRSRFWISCPTDGRVEIASDRLQRWRICFSAFATNIASALDATGAIREICPGRIWKLGSTKISGRSQLAYLLVGLNRPDANVVMKPEAERIPADSLCVVLTDPTVSNVVTLSITHTLLNLSDAAVWTESGVAIDYDLVPKPAAASLVPTPNAASVKIQAGTAWEQLHIIVHESSLEFQVKQWKQRIDIQEAGFIDRRNQKPGRSWQVLTMLARRRGRLGTGDGMTWKQEKLRKTISNIRKQLQDLTGLSADPFQATMRNKDYLTRFKISTTNGAKVVLPSGVTWSVLTLAIIKDSLVVRFSAEVRTTQIKSDGKYQKHEAVSDTEDQERIIPLDDLAWDDPLLNALQDLIENYGRLDCTRTDKTALALNQKLKELTGLTGEPLMWRSGHWKAAFDISSF